MSNSSSLTSLQLKNSRQESDNIKDINLLTRKSDILLDNNNPPSSEVLLNDDKVSIFIYLYNPTLIFFNLYKYR